VVGDAVSVPSVVPPEVPLSERPPEAPPVDASASVVASTASRGTSGGGVQETSVTCHPVDVHVAEMGAPPKGGHGAPV
jgi:hypothetical protein